MSEKIKILCVDDEPNILKGFARLFRNRSEYELHVANSGAEGLKILEDVPGIRIVISDYRMPSMTGGDFLNEVCTRWPQTSRIILSGYADPQYILEAINKGHIYSFLPKPMSDDALMSTISAALQHQFLVQENSRLTSALKESNRELEELNHKLEEQVSARTETLEIRNRVLQIAQGVLDVLPVVVFGIDPEDMVVCCNEYARDFFPGGMLGPFGMDRRDVLGDELNALVDSLGDQTLVVRDIVHRGKNFHCEVRKLHETLTRGIVISMLPRD